MERTTRLFNSLLSIIALIFIACIAYLVDYVRLHSKVNPISFEFKTPSTSITRLTDKNIIRLDPSFDGTTSFDDSPGAESFDEDPRTGDIYTGLVDGRLQRLRFSYDIKSNINAEITDILRVNNTDVGDGSQCSNRKHESSCGRILGLRIWRQENQNGATLIGCEGTRGLFQIDNVDDDQQEHEIKILTSEATIKGKVSNKIHFCNSVVVAPEYSSIFFTDSSSRSRKDYIYDLLDGVPTGRLLRYDLNDKTTTVVKDQIASANGLEMTYEGDGLLVSELGRAIIWKYHLKGNKKGHWSIFSVLPFFPDNIKRALDGKSYSVGGSFWLNPVAKVLLSQCVFLRKALGMFSPDFLTREFSRVLSRDTGVIALLNRTGGIDYIIDGTPAGAKKTSEGFETSNGILLWGAFEYGIPLMASHKFESVVKRQVEQQKKGEKGKEDDDDFIEEVTYGNVIDELELGDNFIDE